MRASARLPVPIWIAVMVAVPLAVVFLLSLAAAAAIAALLGFAYWLLAPSPTPIATRRAARRGIEIELDPDDYRRLPDERHERRRH